MLIAVDTNVLLDQAVGDADVLDAILTLKTRLKGASFIKPFMDAWTWDEDRIDRCCTHVIRPDGKLDSFCRYYSSFAGTK